MFWGVGTSTAFEHMRQELERMQQTYGTAYQRLMGLEPAQATPAEELLCEREQRLLRYEGVGEAPLPTAVLLVPSLLNQASLLDLGPSRSLVRHLLRAGLQVFSTEWHQPAALDRALTLEFYAGFVERSLEAVCAASGQQQATLLGYCSGGILTAITAALHPEQTRNLVQLAAPVSFHDNGMLSQWLRYGIGDVDLTFDTLAALPQPLMRASLQMLKPTLQISQQVALHNQLGDDGVVRDLLALQAWLGAGAFYPLEAYRTLIKSCYRQNALVNSQLLLGGRRVELSAITAALLIVTAAQDRVCPPASAQALALHAASSDVGTIELPGGHLSMLAGRSASQTLWPQLSAWLVARSDVSS